ncbi:unnamed protein product, partial [Sphenostylis stenocarpa]
TRTPLSRAPLTELHFQSSSTIHLNSTALADANTFSLTSFAASASQRSPRRYHPNPTAEA